MQVKPWNMVTEILARMVQIEIAFPLTGWQRFG